MQSSTMYYFGTDELAQHKCCGKFQFYNYQQFVYLFIGSLHILACFLLQITLGKL